jgi:hypothetical protein
MTAGVTRMRRLLAMSLAVLAFAACSGDDDDDSTATSPSTADTAGDTTTATSPGTGTWTYPDLDGQNVTVDQSNDSATTSFVGDSPMPVSIIDKATGDCAALQSELDFWVSQLDDPAIGARASAYAQYALDVGARNRCALTQ